MNKMPIRSRITPIILLAGIAVAGCGNQAGDEQVREQQGERVSELAVVSPVADDQGGAPGAMMATRGGIQNPVPSPMASMPVDTFRRQIIKTVDMTLEVSKVDSALASAERIALEAGGYVGSVSRNEAPPEGARSGMITLKVPAGKTDECLSRLRALGSLKNEHIWTEDVTEDYYDTSIRLKNAQAAREQFEALLRQARRVPEIVEVQRELQRVTEEIERMTGHLRRLSNMIAFSTVNLSVTEPVPILHDRTSVWGRLATALRGMVDAFWSTIAWLIRMLGVVIPVGLLIGAAWWSVRTYLKARTRGKSRNAG